jgi:hypothetical protein
MQGYITGLYSPDGSGTVMPWYDQLHAEGSSQVGNVRKLLTSLSAWPSIYPWNGFIHTSLGTNENHISGMLAADNSSLLVHIPSGVPVAVDVSALGKGYGEAWFDPVDGSWQSATASSRVGSVSTYTPSGNASHSDWVLVLGPDPLTRVGCVCRKEKKGGCKGWAKNSIKC